jgi:hypothetical protein
MARRGRSSKLSNSNEWQLNELISTQDKNSGVSDPLPYNRILAVSHYTDVWPEYASLIHHYRIQDGEDAWKSRGVGPLRDEAHHLGTSNNY